MGGVGARTLGGGTGLLNGEFVVHLFGKDFGLCGTKGFFLSGVTYDAGIFALFLFQMVFMDTTATIPTGSMAESWNFKSFVVYGFFVGGILYPLYANWVWGGGWLSQLGQKFRTGPWTCRFCRLIRSSYDRRCCSSCRSNGYGAQTRQVQRTENPMPYPDITSPWL